MKPWIKIFALSAVIVSGVIGYLVMFTKVLDAPEDCGQSLERLSKMQIEEIELLNDSGKIIKFETHIADDSSERAAGYQHICEDVINKTSILFVYSSPIAGQFHMRNVKAPLDIGFFDERGKLIRAMVMHTYDNGNQKIYDPGQQFQYALEARVGFFDEHKLSEGKAWLVLQSVNN